MDSMQEMKMWISRYQKLKSVLPRAQEQVRQAQEDLSNPALTSKEHSNQLRYMRSVLANYQSLSDEYDLVKMKLEQFDA